MGITHLIKQEKDIEGKDHHSTIFKTEMNLLQARKEQNTIFHTKQKKGTSFLNKAKS